VGAQLKQPARAVLVTGASTGIGEACALELDRRGFRVFAGVRREDDGRRLRQAASGGLTPVLLDVTEPESISTAAETIRGVAGDSGLFGLVNNAGIVVAGPLELLSVDQLRRQFEVNVFGQIAVTQAMLPLLRTARGRIVQMSSVSGRVAAPFLGPYAASKHALEALSDALRVELRRWGIAVSIVEPGNVKTPIWEKSQDAAERLLHEWTPEAHQLYGADIEGVRAASARMAETGMPVQRVVDAVVHALRSRHPRARYAVCTDTWLSIQMFKFLPVRLHDWLLRRAMGLK